MIFSDGQVWWSYIAGFVKKPLVKVDGKGGTSVRVDSRNRHNNRQPFLHFCPGRPSQRRLKTDHRLITQGGLGNAFEPLELLGKVILGEYYSNGRGGCGRRMERKHAMAVGDHMEPRLKLYRGQILAAHGL